MFSGNGAFFLAGCRADLRSEWQAEGGALLSNSKVTQPPDLVTISSEFDGNVHERYIEDCVITGHRLDHKHYQHCKGGPFRGLRLVFHTSTGGMDALIEVCRGSGAEIVEEDEDIYVCSFLEQVPDGTVDVVSPFYIEEVIRQNILLAPSHPLHRPCRIDPITDAQCFIISSTGFDAHDRKRVEAMVRLMGCTYTSFLSTANTVLVTSDITTKSVKTEKARQWNIPIRSYEWLLQGFQTWKLARS